VEFDEYDPLLRQIPSRRLADNILAEITSSKKTSRLSEAELSQPCCTAIQVALLDILSVCNIKADGVVGHSSGEIAAAYACGAITSQEAILIAYYRGRVVRGLSSNMPGGMAAIGLGAQEVERYLQPGVLIGCENSPDSVTLTGDKTALVSVMELIRKENPETLVRALHVDCAYHSRERSMKKKQVNVANSVQDHMKTVEPEYHALLSKQIHQLHPKIPFFSSVTGTVLTDAAELGPSYWARNLTAPVVFSSAVENVLETILGQKVFIEIGPHSALAGPIRQIFRHSKSTDDYISTLTRGQDSHVELLKAFGELWLSNFHIDLEAINGKGEFLVDLPLYSWYYEEPLWFESRLSKEWRLREFPHHDILGSRVLESTDQNPMWRNILRLDVVPWIKEHEVAGNIVFPGVGYICMAAEAIRQITRSAEYTARRIHIKAALVMHQGQDAEVITQLQRAPVTSVLDSEYYNFSVFSLDKGTWIKHVFGQIRAGTEHLRPMERLNPLPRVLSRRAWYRKMKRMGLEYGPRFMGLKDMSAHPIAKIAVANVANDIRDDESTYAVHPVSFDCLLQAISPASYNGLPRRLEHLGIPTYIEEVYVRPPKGDMTIRVTADEEPKASLSGDILATADGEVVIEMKGLQMSAIGDADDGSGQDAHAAVELEWKDDLNFKDASKLIRPLKDRSHVHQELDRFAAACMLETHDVLVGVQPSRPYLCHYFTWLEALTDKIKHGQYAGLADGGMLAEYTSAQRLETIGELYDWLQATEAAATATAIHRILHSCRKIFTGEVDELDLLLGDEVLNQLYDFMQNSGYSAFLDLLSHRKPNMKVLEIGAGTGGTSATVLPRLKSAYGERTYLSYTYTDVSAGFFVSAKQRFRNYSSVEYAVLDISKDPIEQGFEAEAFDLVIACNVRCLDQSPSHQIRY
jgi:acyl transferase domain-containing protein